MIYYLVDYNLKIMKGKYRKIYFNKHTYINC